MEIGALLLLSENDESISLETMYQQLAEEKDGCFWELYEVYRHLKSLGYIVGRHGIPWSLKSVKKNTGTVSSEGTSESLEVQSPQDCNSVIERFIKMDLNEQKLVFDVYLPNGKFRKSSPGDPSYVLSLIRGQPPSKIEIEAIKRQCGGIPLKFALWSTGVSVSIPLAKWSFLSCPDKCLCMQLQILNSLDFLDALPERRISKF
ncbi:hypothetical protein ACJRO7_002324 [Eucalyptus globulus]|uniref:tRNA-splicing endonuclease subunit Sen54 N-terminal domain-containing protein n=1 Tax=Eucalyptus globulus TaxID=34317 RepID=A0ABD3LU03_EUCGL